MKVSTSGPYDDLYRKAPVSRGQRLCIRDESLVAHLEELFQKRRMRSSEACELCKRYHIGHLPQNLTNLILMGFVNLPQTSIEYQDFSDFHSTYKQWAQNENRENVHP